MRCGVARVAIVEADPYAIECFDRLPKVEAIGEWWLRLRCH